ncbi:MAG: hypothetical protein HKL90_03890 [Elusimicrobia bacterium]|nr:hypothetical protein [Elusimicrobiota bacterium]
MGEQSAPQSGPAPARARRRIAVAAAIAAAVIAAALLVSRWRYFRLARDLARPAARSDGSFEIERINGKRREKLRAVGQSLTQLGLGLMLESEGDSDGALRRYQSAQRPPAGVDPDSAGCWRYPFLSDAYALSARVQIKKRRLDDARRTLAEGRRRCPGDPQLALEFADYDRTVGARVNAAAELAAVMRFLSGRGAWVDARFRTLAEGLGRDLIEEDSDPRALGEFARLVERRARAAQYPVVAADLFSLLGEARMKLGENSRAQAAFREYLWNFQARGSRRRYIWLGAARAALATGAHESARAAALLQCARLSAADESLLLLPEAEALRRSDAGGLAPSVAVNPIARDYWRGERELTDGGLARAEALFLGMLAREPGSIAGLAGMERVSVLEGRPIRALWYFEKAQRAVAHMYYSILHEPLGRISEQLRRGVPDAALKPTVYGLTALMPEYMDVIWTIYGGILLERGRPVQARAAALLAQAHARPQHHPDWPFLVLAGVSAMQEDRPAAWSYLNRAQALEPDSLKAICVRLVFDRVDGRLADARRSAERLLKASADIEDPGLQSLVKRLAHPAPVTRPSEFKAAVKDGFDCGLSLP